jgi:hypothetical protein
VELSKIHRYFGYSFLVGIIFPQAANVKINKLTTSCPSHYVVSSDQKKERPLYLL